MKQLMYPQCGNHFSVDEADYAYIVNQVKNLEFEKEIERRLNELKKQSEAEQEAEYFDLQGLPVKNPEKEGIYIIKRGNKVSKSIVR